MRKKKDLLYLSNRWKKINVKDWSAGSVKHLKAKIIFRKVPTLKAKGVIKRKFSQEEETNVDHVYLIDTIYLSLLCSICAQTLSPINLLSRVS